MEHAINGEPTDPETALVYTMVLVSAAEGEMTDPELATIGRLVQTLPVFREFDPERLIPAARHCATLLDGPDGSERVAAAIAAALPQGLRETAYCLACDVAAADGALTAGEKDVLRWLRARLHIDKLVAVAIERAASARFRYL